MRELFFAFHAFSRDFLLQPFLGKPLVSLLQRKQKEVERENEFHYQLIQQALPEELQKELEKQKGNVQE